MRQRRLLLLARRLEAVMQLSAANSVTAAAVPP